MNSWNMKGTSAIETIKKRHSCRSYTGDHLSEKDKQELESFISMELEGPFGNPSKFTLVASEPEDSESLKGMGTYGFIRKPAGFIIGETRESPMHLEDFGYSMERIILHATSIGLGTCWLGGTFKRSRFAEKAGIKDDSTIPAVAALGYIADRKTLTEKLVRSGAGSDLRKDRNELFFARDLKPVNISFYDSGYGIALEMVRLSPSASNKQPWRIVCDPVGNNFHFFMERTEGYNKSIFVKADLQRIDMGIGMCHFELASVEMGLHGSWVVETRDFLHSGNMGICGILDRKIYYIIGVMCNSLILIHQRVGCDYEEIIVPDLGYRIVYGFHVFL